jgi:hypothetical protein
MLKSKPKSRSTPDYGDPYDVYYEVMKALLLARRYWDWAGPLNRPKGKPHKSKLNLEKPFRKEVVDVHSPDDYYELAV